MPYNTSVANLNTLVLNSVFDRLVENKKDYECKNKHHLGTRFERIASRSGAISIEGDKILKKVQDIFHNGLGIKWSPVQLKIFKVAIDAVLPKIYGIHWDSSKTRVLKARGLDKVAQELMIQMARRNGKTYVIAGVSAALLLAVPGIKIAIFSVSERQSKMLKVEIDKRISAAFELGTHVTADDFTKKETNKEKWIYTMNATGTDQELGSYPGSVKVIKCFEFSLSLSLSFSLFKNFKPEHIKNVGLVC